MQLFTKKISLEDISDQAERAEGMMVAIREAMLSPTSGKVPPEFTLSQLAQLCGVAKGSLNHRMRKANLPPGRLNEQGSRREFTLEESIQWIREIRKESLRPAGAEAVTIAMANFKGGTTKTTSAMTLAQGLSLRGHRVLVIDCDPQGSITTLFGLIPYLDVEDEQTLLPVLLGKETSVRSAIRSTYWSGIDLIAANSTLFSAEFALPARSMEEPTFSFWSALDLAIDDVRLDYDVIVIDTPPALSYLTINALMAANGLIMPLPPNLLDFAASIQFWSLFSDLTGGLLEPESGLVVGPQAEEFFHSSRVLSGRPLQVGIGARINVSGEAVPRRVAPSLLDFCVYGLTGVEVDFHRDTLRALERTIEGGRQGIVRAAQSVRGTGQKKRLPAGGGHFPNA